MVPRDRPKTESAVYGQRAVSEALGFLLVFSLILSVSLGVGMAGVGTFDAYTDTDERRNGEITLQTIRADHHDIARGAPYRSTTVDIGDGALRIGDPVTITVEATTSTDTMRPVTIRSRPLLYDFGDAEVVLSSGAIILDQQSGGVMKVGPAFTVREEQSIISLINTSAPEGLTVRKGGTVRVVNQGKSSSLAVFEPVDEQGRPLEATVVLTVHTPRHGQWESFMRAQLRAGSIDVDEEESAVSVSFSTERVYVRQTSVDVRIERR